MPLVRAAAHALHVYEEYFAFQSPAYMDFERGDFSEGSTGALGSLAAQGSENKEYWIDSFFVLISGNIRRNRRKRLWPEEADSAAAWVCPAT
jgi:hypothetical protein